MKKSKIFWSILTFIGILILHYAGYLCVRGFQEINSEMQHCGTVAYKSADEVQIKHGTTTELYLGVDFDDIGRKAINVSVDTYFSNKKGDRVCFTLDARTDGRFQENGTDMLFGLLFCLMGIVGIIIDIVLIAIFIDKWKPIKKFNRMLDGK